MLTEGEGLRPPAPVPIQLSSGDIELLRQEAAKRAAYRGYSRSADKWRRGVISNPILVGLCGEAACCKFLRRRLSCNVDVDTTLRRFGDGGADIILMGVRLQLKTRSSGTRNLIRRVDAKKRLCGLAVHAFVFARLFENQRLVHLLGWCRASDAPEVGAMTKALRGDWWNLDVDGKHLLPMNDLVTELRLRRAS